MKLIYNANGETQTFACATAQINKNGTRQSMNGIYWTRHAAHEKWFSVIDAAKAWEQVARIIANSQPSSLRSEAWFCPRIRHHDSSWGISTQKGIRTFDLHYLIYLLRNYLSTKGDAKKTRYRILMKLQENNNHKEQITFFLWVILYYASEDD